MVKGCLLYFMVMGISVAAPIEQDFNDAQAFVKGLGNQAANAGVILDSNTIPKSDDLGQDLYHAVQEKRLTLETLGHQAVTENSVEKAVVAAGKEAHVHQKDQELQQASAAISQSLRDEANGSRYINKESVYCHDGACSQSQPVLSNDFAGNASKLLAVSGEADAFRQGGRQARLFSGMAVQCKMRPIKFLDCCHDKGWGKDLNLANCTTQDKQLGVAKLTYKAHYIGTYCAKRKRIPGGSVCTDKRHTYCVFPTKIARIIREQGPFSQSVFIKTFGSAKSPDCSGFLAEELSVLNLSLINFNDPIYPFNPTNPFGQGDTNDAGIAVDIAQRQFNADEASAHATDRAQRGQP